MIEIPESNTLAQQINDFVCGKAVQSVQMNHTPHKFTWYFGDPLEYHNLLAGKRLEHAQAQGGNVELQAGEMRALFQDGVNLRYWKEGEKLPLKHQMLLILEDGSALTATVQMYGGIGVYHVGENVNPYYLVAKEKISPLSPEFDLDYFNQLCDCGDFEKLSAKAFLATKQRIPGLGNGVLQDILWHARIHPKTKMGDVSEIQRIGMFKAVKNTIAEMTACGGRDTEKDLFGLSGGYQCILSKKTNGVPCPACGSPIQKGTYLGGAVYYCSTCQKPT